MTWQRRAILAMGLLLGVILMLIASSRLWPLLVSGVLRQGLQTRFHCWVKVVDQEGKGVAGWKCRIVEDHMPLWPFSSAKSIIRVFETNGSGMVEYKSRGAVSAVFFGYNSPPQWRLEPNHLVQTHYLGVTSIEYLQAIQEEPVRFLGSRENPYVIHVFSVGAPQKLLHWEKRIELREIGNYACIDLLSARVWESAIPQGDVALADGLGTSERPAPCSIIVKAGTDCALFPVVDDWGLGPPRQGYVKELCWDRDWQERRRWTYNIFQFYYRLGGEGGRAIKYGKITFYLKGAVQGAKILNYTNLQGERNLFYDGYVRNYDPLPGPIHDYVSPPVQ